MQTIDTTAGSVEYTWPLTITETTGKDISGDTLRLSLGTDTAPGSWRPPDTDYSPAPSARVLQLLIGGSYTPAAGTYWLWSKVEDNPEIVARKHFAVRIV